MMQLAYLAAFLAVLCLILAGQTWWRVAMEDRGTSPDKRPPVLSAARVRTAATATAVAFWLLAVALAVLLLDRL